MNENPKSFWKKSWKGPKAFLFFLLVASIAGFAFALFITAVTFAQTPLLDKHNEAGDAVWYVLWIMAGFIVAVAALYTLAATSRWLFYWLLIWRNAIKLAFAFACLVTLLALFYAEEDWRGKHDWEKYKRAEAAQGENFDWPSVVPAPVPDDQNFAFSPVWIAEIKVNFSTEANRAEAWYGKRIYNDDVSKLAALVPVSTSGLVGTNWWWSAKVPSQPDVSSDWSLARPTDLKPWQTYYRELATSNALAGIPISPQPQSPAQDVLLALSKFDPVIEKERQDSALPYSRFPIGYDDPMPAAILLPHLAALVRHSEVLQLRACAELQLHESDQALADLKLLLRLSEASQTEPFLISHLVRARIVGGALQVVWEGSAAHVWSEPQLTDIDSELATLDFLSDFGSAIRGERALEIANVEFIHHPPQNSLQLMGFKHPRFYSLFPFPATIQIIENMQGDWQKGPTTTQILMLGVGPAGWLDQNELRLARFETKWYLPIPDTGAKTISPSRFRAALNVFHQETKSPTLENLFEIMSFVPGWNNPPEKFACVQTSVNLARVAIALERYRLAHGQYPESLKPLEPQYISALPHDVINGQPLKYRRDADGQFVLYSVGWNETDDGGVVVMNKNKDTNPGEDTNPSVNFDAGDWVWRYPSGN